MKGKLIKLEALRGFAAVYVLLTHLQDVEYIKTERLSFLLKFGQEAVMLFFLLSGFVIHYSFQKAKDQTFSTYFKNRFLRIYIPLILIFILNYVLYKLFTKPISDNVTAQLFGNLFMLQDIAQSKPNVICNPFLMNGPLWSLSYEWWFYMLYFFYIKFFKDKSFIVVALLAIISAITYIFYPFFVNRLLMYMVIWWAGVEMAKIYIGNKQFNIYNLRKLFTVMLVCIGIMALNWYLHYDPDLKTKSYPFIEFRNLASSILVILAAIFWKKINWLGFKQTIGLFTFLAPISYTIYISHYFLVIYPDYLSFINNKFIIPIIGTFICLIVSFVIERMIYPKIIAMINKNNR